MQVYLKSINPLPVLTWNRLGVNSASLQAEAHVQPAAVPQAPEDVAAVETGMGAETVAFVAQNCTECHVYESAGSEAETPYVQQYTLTAGQGLVDRTCIRAKAGSSITVVQSYVAGDDSACFHGGLTQIIAEKGAHVRLVQVQLLNDASTHFDDVGALIGDDATVEVVQVELGGAQAFAGCLGALQGYQSKLDIKTAYLGDNSRKLDFNYVARQTGRKTNSEIHAAGALFGRSEKVFRGTIDFRKGAARSTGHESEDTLLFSPDARNRTVPLILCTEEDVEGQHAATIGKINAQRMYYLQSRGLSEAEAKHLVVLAQFAPVFAEVPDESLRDQIDEYLERRMQFV